jgi:hypothetical protein
MVLQEPTVLLTPVLMVVVVHVLAVQSLVFLLLEPSNLTSF